MHTFIFGLKTLTSIIPCVKAEQFTVLSLPYTFSPPPSHDFYLNYYLIYKDIKIYLEVIFISSIHILKYLFPNYKAQIKILSFPYIR